MHFEKNIIFSLISIWSNFAAQKGIKWSNSFLQWNFPMGIKADFALNLALPIAHKHNVPVKDIAQQILSLTENNKHLRGEISPQGYINFRLSSEYYVEFLREIVATKKNLPLNQKQEKTVLLEYASVNPTGQLHLGHARVVVIGDTLANVYQHLGYKVIREYYINDRGRQINSLVNSVWYYYCLLHDFPFTENNANLEYQTSTIKETAQFLNEKYGDTLLKKKQLDLELLAILRRESLEFLLNKIKDDLKECGVIFDSWISETELCKGERLTKLIQELKNRNLVYNEEGALLLRTTLAGDEKNRVLVKKNGDYTYLLPDILYHTDKLNKADNLINIWGADHHGYVARIKAACQLLDYDQQRIEIILVQMLSLLTSQGQSQKFSKRLGTTINLDEALKWWGKDWLRFNLLCKDANSHLEISGKSFQTEKKDQLYYLQYAHARAHQLLAKAQEKGIKLDNENANLTWSEEERNILKSLLRFFFVIQLIVTENKPHHLIHYLTELAQTFQAYYQKEIIIEKNNLAKTQQRLLLVQGTKETLKIGLNLAGIDAPNQM